MEGLCGLLKMMGVGCGGGGCGDGKGGSVFSVVAVVLAVAAVAAAVAAVAAAATVACAAVNTAGFCTQVLLLLCPFVSNITPHDSLMPMATPTRGAW